MWKDIISKS